MKVQHKPYPENGNTEKRDQIIAMIREVCGWMPGAYLRAEVPEVTLRRVYRKWYVIDHARVVYSGALAGAMALFRAVLEARA